MGDGGKIRRSRNILLWLRVVASFLSHLGSQVWNANGQKHYLMPLERIFPSLPHRVIIFYVEDSFMCPFLPIFSLL